jgi:predicted nucleic acid-binding protein
MPEVVCDSSTLIHLARINRIILLRDFHGKIILSPAVWKEVVDEGQGRPGSSELKVARDSGWIEVIAPENKPLIQMLERELHKGESETIALAAEMYADLVFLDESDARTAARILGLKISGVIGILIKARLVGKIPSLRDELDRLREDAGFWIGDDLYHRVLKAAGEE